MTIEERIRTGDKSVIKTLYQENQLPFLRFAKRYQLPDADIEDTYQDAVVVLIENIRKGKVDKLTSSVSTYLFAIGKLMIFQRLKKSVRFDYFIDFENLGLVWEQFDDHHEDERSTLLKSSLEKLGEQCRKLLTLFYYENKKLDAITRELEYDSKDVTKSQKSRCLKRLKELMKK